MGISELECLLRAGHSKEGEARSIEHQYQRLQAHYLNMSVSPTVTITSGLARVRPDPIAASSWRRCVT